MESQKVKGFGGEIRTTVLLLAGMAMGNSLHLSGVIASPAYWDAVPSLILIWNVTLQLLDAILAFLGA
jgi:hypothetical protein